MKFSRIVSVGILLVGLPLLAHAADANLTSVGAGAGMSSTDLMTIIGRVIGVLLSVLGVIFLVLFIYAGFIWMTAGGDGKRVDKAKQILINAVVGLVLTLTAYGISTFVINLLGGATDGTSSGINSGAVSIERLSGSLGSGAIRDHYPARNASDVSRNTRIFVTFRDQMDIASFITGYNTNSTPTDTSDDTAGTGINTTNVKIYVRDSGDGAALTNVAVNFTDDLKTFSFDPAENLGSSTENVTYAVYLSDKIKNVSADAPLDSGGYLWYFTTGTTLDTTPPTITSVTPAESSRKDRNISVQVTFSEPVDPTSASGIRYTDHGFQNIQTKGATADAAVAGTYSIGNGYKTTTFTSTDACGTNSCGETIYCLPKNDTMTVTVASAAPTSSTDPTASIYPYDGIVDMSGNSMDGNADGSVGSNDDYVWSFSTTDNVNLSKPSIETILPNIAEEDVSLDQDIQMTFDSVLDVSSVNGSSVVINNKETKSGDSHELWYTFRVKSLTASGEEVTTASQTPAKSLITISHGTFLASDASTGISYMYGVTANEGVKNEYQNCFAPGAGPSSTGATCNATDSLPYCCNGSPQATACTLF